MRKDRSGSVHPEMLTKLSGFMTVGDPVPIYYRLELGFRQLINDGALVPGEILPAEDVLANLLHISRQTVRHTYRRLSDEGLVERTRGQGTILTSRAAGLDAPPDDWVRSL